jgi:hypothetical protein
MAWFRRKQEDNQAKGVEKVMEQWEQGEINLRQARDELYGYGVTAEEATEIITRVEDTGKVW